MRGNTPGAGHSHRKSLPKVEPKGALTLWTHPALRALLYKGKFHSIRVPPNGLDFFL
jgi:hypothetical protein